MKSNKAKKEEVRRCQSCQRNYGNECHLPPSGKCDYIPIRVRRSNVWLNIVAIIALLAGFIAVYIIWNI